MPELASVEHKEAEDDDASLFGAESDEDTEQKEAEDGTQAKSTAIEDSIVQNTSATKVFTDGKHTQQMKQAAKKDNEDDNKEEKAVKNHGNDGNKDDDDDDDGDLLDSLMQEEEETEHGEAKQNGQTDKNVAKGPLLLEAFAAEEATEAFMRERKLREEKLERLELSIGERADAENRAAAAKREMDERTEKYSGLRLRNRVMPADVLERNMAGRQFMKLSQLNETVLADMARRSRKDWVLIGVLTDKKKTPPDAARARNMPRSTWTVSDLAARRTFISLGLYDGAHAKHYDRTPIGSVVLLYEPSVRPSKSTHSKVAFYLSASLDTHIMLLGDALDFALCAGTGYNGEYCKEPVNSRISRFCPKHETAELANIRSNRMMLHSSSGIKISQPRSSSVRNLSSVDEDTANEQKPRSGTKRKLSTAEQLRQARQRKLAAESAAKQTRGNAIVLADGSISVKHDEGRGKKAGQSQNKKLKTSNGLSDRANVIVNALNSSIRDKGHATVAQQTTKGLRRAYAAITGADIQAQSRRDNAQEQRDLQRAMKDPLTASNLAKKRTKMLAASGGAMTARVGALSRKSAPTKLDEAKALAGSLDPRLQAKIRASSSVHTSSNPDGRFGVNEQILRQRRAEERVVQERARQRFERESNAKEMKSRANLDKMKHVKALLQKNGGVSALAPVDANSSRLRDLKRVKITAPPPGAANDKLKAFTSKRARPLELGTTKLASHLSGTAGAKGSGLPAAPRSREAGSRPDIVSSLKQGLDATKMQELLKKKSAFQDAGNHAKADALQNTMRGLASAEAASDKKSQVTELKIKAILCHECERTTEDKMPRCQVEEHETSQIEVTKRFFRCAKPDCGERTSTLGKKTCRQPCPACAGIRWVPCSAYSDKTLGLARKRNVPAGNNDDDGPCTTFNRRGG